jgi:hypothetical protein
MKLLGDLVHDVATLLGIEECGACKRRRRKLNAADARVRAGLKRKGRSAPCAECDRAKGKK